jgi:hypothetical protein
MIYLVQWNDDWFVAVISQVADPQYTCKLQAPNDPKFEQMGFKRLSTADRHFYRFFEKDPGFKYFSELKYKGCPVGLSFIRADAMPREAYVHSSVRPPDAEEWNYDARDGYDRYVKIDELEKVETEAPDWSQIG